MTRREALQALGAAVLAVLAPPWLIQGVATDPDAPLTPEELAKIDAILKQRYAAVLEQLIPEEMLLQRFAAVKAPRGS